MFQAKLKKVSALVLLASFVSVASANSTFDGQADNATSSYGYYYAITGGKFPTGDTPNGDNASGGTFRFLLDSPDWGGYALGQWNKDDWFPSNAGIALTLRNGQSIVYDNNGLEDGSYGDYYDASDLSNSGDKPGLYRGYSMSNNWDWIYAGYFKIEQTVRITEMIGYFDPNSGFDPDSPEIRYDMNIWSAYQDMPQSRPSSWMPINTGGFAGDVFSAKTTPGSFAWSDTGVDRVFGTDYNNDTDDIYRLSYTLEEALVLEPGVYFFSHDAEIAASQPVPEPVTVLAFGSALAGLSGYIRRRRRT